MNMKFENIGKNPSVSDEDNLKLKMKTQSFR